MRSDVTEALKAAFFKEWAERGYAALSLERVAQEAHVGKAALYRRWSSKRLFAEDAVVNTAVKLISFDDQGSFVADVEDFLTYLRKVYRHPIIKKVLPDLQAECARSQELATLLAAITEGRRARAEVILDRAVSRGELSEDFDRELALDLLPSSLYWRMIVRQRRVSMQDIRNQALALTSAIQASGSTADRHERPHR